MLAFLGMNKNFREATGFSAMCRSWLWVNFNSIHKGEDPGRHLGSSKVKPNGKRTVGSGLEKREKGQFPQRHFQKSGRRSKLYPEGSRYPLLCSYEELKKWPWKEK